MPETAFDTLVEDYVWLALQLHNHDRNPYVFIGDPALRARARAAVLPLVDLDRALAALADALPTIPPAEVPGRAYRCSVLRDRIDAMRMRSGILQGRMPASFDDEARTLYALDVPRKDEAHFRALAGDLEQVVPGTGPLPERLIAFRDRFLIAPGRIEAVMRQTLAEARKRTRAHMDLPEHEGITVQMAPDGPFSGFA